MDFFFINKFSHKKFTGIILWGKIKESIFHMKLVFWALDFIITN